jgi:iron complex outermembrane receptor protein
VEKKSKFHLFFAAALAFSIAGYPLPGHAEETGEFSLDQVLVTALREQSTELKTSASVEIIPQQKLLDTGAQNLFQALERLIGSFSDNSGFNGNAQGRVSGKIVFRGAEKGTLVLLNGVPINLDGKYSLDNIPLQSVEKIEVVRGAAAVLYGNQAFGGTINIITKKSFDNSLTVSAGNYGQIQHDLTLQAGNFGMTGSFGKTGKFERLTAVSSGRYYNWDGSEKDTFTWNYQLSDKISIMHQHAQDEVRRSQINANNGSTYSRLFDDREEDLVILKYEAGNLRASAFFNRDDLYYNTRLASSGSLSSESSAKSTATGVDIQQSWVTPYAKFISGVSAQQEEFTKIDYLSSSNSQDKDRSSYSVYLNATKQLNDRTTVIIGGRGQTVVEAGENDKSAFCPQFQLLEALSADQTWYVNVGKTFRVPTFSELYSTNYRGLGNPDLSPETGWNYETGWKRSYGDASLTLALFRMDFDDQISTRSINATDSQYFNYSKFKNTGVEIDYKKQPTKQFSYSFGVGYSDPKRLTDEQTWEKLYGKLSMNAGLNYTVDKTQAAFYVHYQGHRVNDVDPYIAASLTVKQTIDNSRTVFIAVDNLFDRRDVINLSSESTRPTSYYYSVPRTYRIGYTQRF